jgi:hypothetical protein
MGRLGGRPSHKSEPRRKRLGALQRMDQANPSLAGCLLLRYHLIDGVVNFQILIPIGHYQAARP